MSRAVSARERLHIGREHPVRRRHHHAGPVGAVTDRVPLVCSAGYDLSWLVGGATWRTTRRRSHQFTSPVQTAQRRCRRRSPHGCGWTRVEGTGGAVPNVAPVDSPPLPTPPMRARCANPRARQHAPTSPQRRQRQGRSQGLSAANHPWSSTVEPPTDVGGEGQFEPSWVLTSGAATVSTVACASTCRPRPPYEIGLTSSPPRSRLVVACASVLCEGEAAGAAVWARLELCVLEPPVDGGRQPKFAPAGCDEVRCG
jgi:hypothetical protein